jgi:hypothetical protein
MHWREECTWFWCENLKERDYSDDQGINGRMESECVRQIVWGLWSGFS